MLDESERLRVAEDIRESIYEFRGERAWGYNSCHLLVLLGFLLDDLETQRQALERTNDWYLSATSSISKAAARRYKGFVHFVGGEPDEAIKWTEKALQELERVDRSAQGMNRALILTKNNLAYYYSEIAGTTIGKRLEACDNARRHIQEVKDIYLAISGSDQEDERMQSFIMDTEGAVLVSCGATKDEVKKGVKLCEEAVVKGPEDRIEAQKLVCELHERRAMRRLLTMTG